MVRVRVRVRGRVRVVRVWVRVRRVLLDGGGEGSPLVGLGS